MKIFDTPLLGLTDAQWSQVLHTYYGNAPYLEHISMNVQRGLEAKLHWARTRAEEPPEEMFAPMAEKVVELFTSVSYPIYPVGLTRADVA